MKEIPGFKTLKAFKHGRKWYIVDCTPECGDPYRHVIGDLFNTYEAACIFATVNYLSQYN
jgi:hypothetical protein